MWTCQNCSEHHEDQFDSCWKCGTEKTPGTSAEPSGNLPPALPRESWPPGTGFEKIEKTCFRCSLSLELYGRQTLDHPHGGLTEILMTPVMEAWKCPRCQRVEFYAQ